MAGLRWSHLWEKAQPALLGNPLNLGENVMEIPITVREHPEPIPEKLKDHIIESGLLNDRLIEVTPEQILIYPKLKNYRLNKSWFAQPKPPVCQHCFNRT